MFFFTVPVHRQDERARADEFQAALERSEFQYQQMMDEYSQLEMAADPSAMRMMKQAMQDCDDQIAKLQRDLDKKELEVEKLHEQVSPTGSRRFRRIKFPIVSFLFFFSGSRRNRPWNRRSTGWAPSSPNRDWARRSWREWCAAKTESWTIWCAKSSSSATNRSSTSRRPKHCAPKSRN